MSVISSHGSEPDDDDLEEEPDYEPWIQIQRTTFTNWVSDTKWISSHWKLTSELRLRVKL